MDPILLLSSMFIFFFFGFNADSFLGTEENVFMTQALIERATKAFCGSTMLYGLQYFTGLYKDNHTIQTRQIAAGQNQLDGSSSDGRESNEKSWEGLDNGHTASTGYEGPTSPSQHISNITETPSTYASKTMERPVWGHTATVSVIERHYYANPDAYLTKYNFGVFVLCLLLPFLILWSMNNSKRRAREQTQIHWPNNHVGNHGCGVTCCPSCCARSGTNDIGISHTVSEHNQLPEVSTEASITGKLDEILAYTRAPKNKNESNSDSAEVHTTEFESLKDIIDMVMSSSETQAQELEFLRTEQRRIEYQMFDLKDVEERVNERLDESLREVQNSWQQQQQQTANLDMEPVQRRLDILEFNCSQFAGWLENFDQFEVDLFNQIEDGKILMQDQLQRQFVHTESLKRQVDIAKQEINNIFHHIEQAQKQTRTTPNTTGTLQDLNKQIEQAQQEGSIASNYDGELRNLNTRVEELKKTVLQITDISDTLEKLDERVGQVQQHAQTTSDIGGELKDLWKSLEQVQKQVPVITDLEGKLHNLGKRFELVRKQVPITSYSASKFQDLDARLDQVQAAVPKARELVNKYHELERRVDRVQQHVPMISDLANKFQDLEEQLAQAQMQIQREENAMEKLRQIENRLSGYDSILNENIQQTLKTHENNISTLKNELGKMENDQHEIEKRFSDHDTQLNENLQQMLGSYETNITKLREQVGKIQNEQKGVSERLRRISEQSSDTTTLAERLVRFETAINKRIVETNAEINNSLEQNIGELDIDDLRIRLDLVESTREDHAGELQKIQAQLTAQEEMQTDLKLRDMTARIEEITKVMDSFHSQYLEDNASLESRLSLHIGIFEIQIPELQKTAGDIQREVQTLRQKVYSEALYSADPVEDASMPIVKKIEELEKEVQRARSDIDIHLLIPLKEAVQTQYLPPINPSLGLTQPGQTLQNPGIQQANDSGTNQPFHASTFQFGAGGQQYTAPAQSTQVPTSANAQIPDNSRVNQPSNQTSTFSFTQSNFNNSFLKTQKDIRNPDWTMYDNKNPTHPPQRKEDEQGQQDQHKRRSIALEDVLNTSILKIPIILSAWSKAVTVEPEDVVHGDSNMYLSIKEAEKLLDDFLESYDDSLDKISLDESQGSPKPDDKN